MQMRVKCLHPKAVWPEYKSEEAAGMDLTACFDGDPIELWPFDRKLIPTGIAIEMDPGFEAQIRPRSGLAFNYGITVFNSPGTIDSDYRGELKVLLVNFSNVRQTIKSGDRIAQMVVAPVARAVVLSATALSESARGEGGWGSTGGK
jgi:dUTP pyrophosphatase